jgi:MOSC domain-containing protein YiiM
VSSAYGTVIQAGTIRVGDPVTLVFRPEMPPPDAA